MKVVKRAMTTIENSNRLLKEVNRSLHPLESVSSAVVVELTDQGGATEVKRLKQQLRAFLAAHLPAHKPEQSTPGVFIGTNVGKHPVINVTDKAKNLYPNPLSYPALHAACTAPVLTVWLCQPRDSKEMVFKLLRPSFLCVASNSDLRMDFEAMISATSLTYEQDTDQLVAEIDFAVVPKHDWENNGLYASVLDIPNSSCLAFLNLYTYPQPAINYNLRVIKLSFSGENFWIEKPKVLVKDDGAFRFISTTLVK